MALKNEYNVKQIAPAHCTSEAAVQTFLNIFKDNFIHAGLDSTIQLPR